MLVLPIVVPLGTAAALMLAPKRPVPQRWISLTGSVLLLASALLVFLRVNATGIQVLQISGWPAPFGITLVADLFAAILVVAVGVVGVAISGVALSGVDPQREAFGYHAVIQILLMGVAGAFLTGDLFNLYVWFEVMLVASFVLMALHRTRAQVEAAFKYVTINLIASSIFLTALGLLYGATGTLNMADLARVWPTIRTPGVDTVLPVLFLIAFQGGAVPAVLLAARLVSHASGCNRRRLRRAPHQGRRLRLDPCLHAALPWRAAGALRTASCDVGGDDGDRTGGGAERARLPPGALVQSCRPYRLYHGESRLLTPAALAGAVFYVVHHIVVITNLYLVSGVLLRLRRTTDMAGLGGMYRHQPVFSALAMVPIFSLAGVPPLSGFLGKLAILEGTFDAGAFWLGGLVPVVGLLTLLSMARTWADGFWRPAAEGNDLATPGTPFLVAIGALSLLTAAMTIGAEPLFELTTRGAQQLLHRDEYVRAVLGDTR